MDLPPQPQPSAIEVTYEDDPLTLEWPVGLGNAKRIAVGMLLGGASLASAGGALFLGASIWSQPGFPSGGDLFGTLALLVLALLLALAALFGLRRMAALAGGTGQARLVLQKDALIWVPGGGGQIPQVYRKSEILRIEAGPGRVALVLEDAPHRRFHVRLKGRFATGDPAWLGGVLQGWFAQGKA